MTLAENPDPKAYVWKCKNPPERIRTGICECFLVRIGTDTIQKTSKIFNIFHVCDTLADAKRHN
jgi:hypothetical protein